MTKPFQGPTTGEVATSMGEMYSIVTHPAFRLGFLDAQNKRPFNHDDIMGRIERETPASALKRIKWRPPNDLMGRLFDISGKRTEIAQYRYEEGRYMVLLWGLKCKAWGHPDYPPVQVTDKIYELSKARSASEPNTMDHDREQQRPNDH